MPEEHYGGRPIPVFGYNRKDGFMDLMFPDFTFYGNEYSQITGGWRQKGAAASRVLFLLYSFAFSFCHLLFFLIKTHMSAAGPPGGAMHNTAGR